MNSGVDRRRERWRHAAAYAWSTAGVALATALLYLLRHSLDPGHASLLYLPVVIVCSIRLGFGPAMWGAVFSFVCWDFFFLPPYHTFVISNPNDWLALMVFLVTALATALLASQSERRAEEARAREGEITMLYRASETVSREVEENRQLSVLARELLQACGAPQCSILRRTNDGSLDVMVDERSPNATDTDVDRIRSIAAQALEHDQVIGFGTNQELWLKALAMSTSVPVPHGEIGLYVPLHAQERLVGVLYVGPRRDGREYSAIEQRLIFTMANHAAIAITRQTLMAEAAQANALREADALKEALLSLVSHELRTPLASIKASATGLLQQDSSWSDDERGSTLRAINQEADRLSQVVNNLLDLSRLEAGAWKPARDWCDPSEIVGTVLDRMSTADAERIHVEAADDLPFVCVDYVQIALVLTNLLENALKYSPPDSPIDLTMGVNTTQGEQALNVAIRDRGPGIDADEAERLFTRFYRGAKHRRGTVHGTGLGLALCDAIVRAHGGRIEAKNAGADDPGGAVFRFTIPSYKHEHSDKPSHTDDPGG